LPSFASLLVVPEDTGQKRNANQIGHDTNYQESMRFPNGGGAVRRIVSVSEFVSLSVVADRHSIARSAYGSYREKPGINNEEDHRGHCRSG